MADRRAKTKGRRERGSFLALPHDYVRAAEFNALSPRAAKAFVQLAAQYTGRNNGLLALPRSRQRDMGWPSHHPLRSALTELVDAGWAVVTRPGGKHVATLYGLTIWKIDDCGLAHLAPPTTIASNAWKKTRTLGLNQPNPCAESAPIPALERAHAA